jgi:molybdopterin-guanine dinucleotide biosynthesis protein A
MNCAALVLCGGQSRRMGTPKEWLSIGNERMVQRVVRLVATVADPVAVVAAPGQSLPELPPSVAIYSDAAKGRGPLEGLATGLAALPPSVEFVFAIGADSPLLQPAWIKRLVQLIGENDLAIPYVGGFHHPLAAVYRRTTSLPAIERLMATGRSALVDLVDAVRTRLVTADELCDVDSELDTLRNLNTPEDYKAALADLGTQS